MVRRPAAPQRRPPGSGPQLHHLRRRRTQSRRQTMPGAERLRPRTLPPKRNGRRHLGGQKPARIPRTSPRGRRRGTPARVRPRLPRLRETPPPQQRDRLGRADRPLRSPARILPPDPRGNQGTLPLPAGGRVPGHQRRPVPAGPAAGRRPGQHLRHGRPRPVDLLLAQRRPRKRQRLPQGLPRSPDDTPGAQLPLHRQHPERRQGTHPPEPGKQQPQLDPRRETGTPISRKNTGTQARKPKPSSSKPSAWPGKRA